MQLCSLKLRAVRSSDSAEPICPDCHQSFKRKVFNKYSGRISIQEKDQQASLLFSGKEPETSFTTFRVDGNDYIYGNEYSYKDRKPLHKPSGKNGFVTQSKCRIGNLEITQS